MTTSAGDVLSELSSLSDIMVPGTFVKLVLIALVFLMMPWLKRRLMSRTGADKDDDGVLAASPQ